MRRTLAAVGAATAIILGAGALPATADPVGPGFKFTLTCNDGPHAVVINGRNNAPIIHDLLTNTIYVPYFAQDEYTDVYDDGQFVERMHYQYPDDADVFNFRPGNGNGRKIQLCQYAFPPVTWNPPDDDPDLGDLTYYRFGTLGVQATP